jgi:hypothetical protein
VDSLEKEARNVDRLPDAPRELIELCLHELNLVLFGCELRYFASAKLVVNADGTKYVPIQDHGELTASTSLRKTSASAKNLSSINMMIYLQGLIQKMEAPNLLNFSESLFTAVAPKLTEIYQPIPQYADELDALLNRELGSYEKDPVPIPHTSDVNTDSPVDDVETEVTQESIQINKTEHTARAVARKKSIAYGSLRTPGGTKKEKHSEETEDIKTKKGDFNYFMTRLQCFLGDQAKLEAILEGFRAITQGAKGLRVFEKTIELVVKTEQLIRRLLDMGCLLVTSSPDSFSRPMSIHQMEEYTASHSAKFHFVHRFRALDYCNFLSHLYAHHQWVRFKAYAPGVAHFPSLCGEQRETIEIRVKIRLAVIKYYSSLHMDRKVAFETLEENMLKSLNSLVEKRYEVPDKLYQATMNLVFVGKKYLQILPSEREGTSAVSDVTVLLWKFLEFFVKDINHAQASLPFPDGSTQNILTMLQSAHWLSTQLIVRSGDAAFILSRKLSLVLECIGNFKDAYRILDVVNSRIFITRQTLGENGSLSDSLTSQVAHLTASYSSEKNQAALTNLACIQVDVLAAKYRCHIKMQYQETMRNLQDRMEQHFRLTKKQIILLPEFQADDITINLKEICGDDVTKQLLYCLSFARHASHYPLSLRKACIRNAYKKLSQAMVMKCGSARLSRGGSGGATRKIGFKILFKNSTSMAIQAIVPEAEKTQNLCFRAFCRRKSLNDTVSVTNTQFMGAGKRCFTSPRHHL